MKLLCVLLPHFLLNCEISRDPQVKAHASVVVRESGSRKLVLDYSPELTGIEPGMELQSALSRHGDTRIIHADIPYYHHRFNRILDAMENVSPIVEGPEPGLIYLGMDGMQLIYPGDAAAARAVREAIPGSFVIRIGTGPSKFLAYLAARQCPEDRDHMTLSGDTGSFLNDLPCDILPVSSKSIQKLREFGLRTLGQITALPPGPLQAQFGEEGRRIRDLARGRDDTPLYPRSLKETIEVDTALTWVTVSVEAMLSIVESLLTKALAGKELHGRGITCLSVWTRGQNEQHWEKTVNFKEPAMDAASALPRIRYYLQKYPQPGPVEQVGIRITRFGHSTGRQKSIFSEVRAKDHLLDNIKQLELRLNAPQLYRVKEIEPWSRIPERRHALTPLNR